MTAEPRIARVVASFALSGEPCLSCGHPASKLVIYPNSRSIWHATNAPVCVLPNPPAREVES